MQFEVRAEHRSSTQILGTASKFFLCFLIYLVNKTLNPKP
jgi:hypothetical protein